MRAAQLDPVTALAGNHADVARLRWANAAVATAGDVLARLSGNTTGQGVGLRGGSFRVVDDGSMIHVTLTQVRWTEDLAVSGIIDKSTAQSGAVRARLHLAAADALTGDLTVEWFEGIAASSAAIRGTMGGATLLARTAAP
jgi:hypothetical protein